jgi:uncharacterized protein YyaL (SSP411 family)
LTFHEHPEKVTTQASIACGIGSQGTLIAVHKYFSRLVVTAAVVMLGQPSPMIAGESGGGARAAGEATVAPEFTNRLIHSRNPYLLLHAHNPVDWYPWGPEAFAKAKREDKPIFVSIGYSTCYWCHVAERTIYSNPEIAELMNRWFVNVKVDREQRPDIDRIYMQATGLLTGRGGWPNNVFLTHDQKPFFAGSYFPPEDDPRRGAGFPTILKAIHNAWRSNRQKVEGLADKVAAALRRVQPEETALTVTSVRSKVLLKRARDTLLQQFDSKWGGIADPRSRVKFPRAPQLTLLLADHRIHQSEASLAAVTKTLDAMSFGGINDHLAGGFHRYSVEPSWSIPHFEKMLYDNAQLLRLYAEAFEITGDPLYKRVALDIGEYLGRDMMSPDGGFYTAQDAQVDGIEGASRQWTPGQIADVLGEQAAKRFLRVYTLVPVPHPVAPDVPVLPEVNGERPGVLRVRHPVDQTMKRAGFEDIPRMLESFAADRAKLLAARNRRPQPARDEKIVTALNGLAIAALSESAILLREPRFATWAERSAERIWTLAYDEKSGTLKREIYLGKAQTDGFLQDYAMLGQALLWLARATETTLWRDRAVMLSQNIVSRFLRADGSLSMTTYGTGLLIPVFDDRDFDTPSATSAALGLLLQTDAAISDAGYAGAAASVVRRLSGLLDASPESRSSAIVAINRYPLPESRIAASAGKAPVSGKTPGGAFSLPATADHVRASAAAKMDGSIDEVIVTIEVDEGYHINANPASFDYLIPTSVSFSQAELLEIRYPAPTRFVPDFAPDGLDVYEGSVALTATFPKGSLNERQAVHGLVTVQACNDRVCLPPSTLSVPVTEIGMQKAP